MIIDSLHGPWPWATQAKYAQAGRAGDLILTGGIGPFDEEGDLINGDCAAQVHSLAETSSLPDPQLVRSFT